MSGSSSPPGTSTSGPGGDLSDADGAFMRWAKKPWHHLGFFTRQDAIQLLRDKMVSQKRRMLMKDCVRIIYYCQVQRSSQCRYEMSICVPLDPAERIRIDDFNEHSCDMDSNRLRRRVLPQLEDFDRPIEKRNRVERNRDDKSRKDRKQAAQAAASIQYEEDYQEPDAATSLAMSLIPQAAEEENSNSFNEAPRSSVWTTVEVDIVDLTKKPDGCFKYIMNCTDQATRFSYAIALMENGEAAISQALLELMYTFGAPEEIQITGVAVENSSWAEVKGKFPSVSILSVPWKKNNQGVVVLRREAQIVKERLFAWVVENDCIRWSSELKAMKYAHNSEWIEDLGGTPMDLFYRRGKRMEYAEGIDAEQLLTNVKFEVCNE